MSVKLSALSATHIYHSQFFKLSDILAISLSGCSQRCTWGSLPERPLSLDSTGTPPPSSPLPLSSSCYCISSILFVYLHKLQFLFNKFLAQDLRQYVSVLEVRIFRYFCFLGNPEPGPGPGGWELSPSRWPSCTHSRALRWWAAPSRGSRRSGRAFSILTRVLIVCGTPQAQPGQQID